MDKVVVSADEAVADLASGDVGGIAPDDVHLPGVFVQRVVPLTREQAARKSIEKRTVRAWEGAGRAVDA